MDNSTVPYYTSPYSTNVGALFVGVLAQIFLLGTMAILSCFFLVCPKKTRLESIVVGTLLSLNVFDASLNIVVFYRTGIIHYGSLKYFNLQTWPMWVKPGLSAVVAFVAQCFLSLRCSRIMQSRVFCFLLTTFCLVPLASGLAISILFSRLQYLSELPTIPVVFSSWLVSTAMLDLVITTATTASLLKISESTISATVITVIRRVIKLCLQTGGVVTAMAVINLILFFAEEQTTFYLIPQSMMSPLYGLAVIGTLLHRNSMNGIGAGDIHSTNGIGAGDVHIENSCIMFTSSRNAPGSAIASSGIIVSLKSFDTPSFEVTDSDRRSDSISDSV